MSLVNGDCRIPDQSGCIAAGNSEDESSSSYSSACEDPVDGEENSSHGSSGGDEGAEAEMREVMTMEDLMIDQIEHKGEVALSTAQQGEQRYDNCKEDENSGPDGSLILQQNSVESARTQAESISKKAGEKESAPATDSGSFGEKQGPHPQMRPTALSRQIKGRGRPRKSNIFLVRDRSGNSTSGSTEKYKDSMPDFRVREILTSRPRNERHVLNEIVSILIKRRSELDEMNGIEAAIRYLIQKDNGNETAFNERAQRLW